MSHAMALILGLETSCDETAVALYDTATGAIEHAVAAQPASHRPYGGVVPELASRDHAGQLVGLLDQLGLKRAADAVACAAGPGLAGCLAAGLGLAQALAYAWRAPLAPVNHLEGHLLSPMLEAPAGFGWPYLALLVSGGHSMLVRVEERGRYAVLGTTLDDAAGEAFDKTGQLLGLDYPGGPRLEELARDGDPAAAPLAPALRGRDDCMLSFAGLKTAARRLHAAGHRPADIAASFQEAVVATLAAKTERALRLAGCGWLAAVGGVARNQLLRARLDELGARLGVGVCYPPLRWCTDNAAMIAYAGQFRQQQGYAAAIRPRWPLTEL